MGNQYLVRWKFGPNSLLNHLDRETPWYQEFHPDKDSAVDHYIKLLPDKDHYDMTIEIFKLVTLQKRSIVSSTERV